MEHVLLLYLLSTVEKQVVIMYCTELLYL